MRQWYLLLSLIPALLAADICSPNVRHMRITARHIEGGGVGYNQGYTTGELFLGSNPNQWFGMPFMDLRAHVFNNGRYDFNAGIGLRSTLGCRVYGINAYYDYRNARHSIYNQVAIGLETLGAVFDFRLNGYLPVGKKVSAPYRPTPDGIANGNILTRYKYEYAMSGVDMEAGFHLGSVAGVSFYLAAGPYYFKGTYGKGAAGGEARLTCAYKEYITLDLIDSCDTVFHNNVQGQIALTLPFGSSPNESPAKQKCSPTLCGRMAQPVRRQEITVLNRHWQTVATPLPPP